MDPVESSCDAAVDVLRRMRPPLTLIHQALRLTSAPLTRSDCSPPVRARAHLPDALWHRDADGFSHAFSVTWW